MALVLRTIHNPRIAKLLSRKHFKTKEPFVFCFKSGLIECVLIETCSNEINLCSGEGCSKIHGTKCATYNCIFSKWYEDDSFFTYLGAPDLQNCKNTLNKHSCLPSHILRLYYLNLFCHMWIKALVTYPIVISNMLLPTELETAMSPRPLRATITLVIRSGMDVPAARMVRPIISSEMPMVSPTFEEKRQVRLYCDGVFIMDIPRYYIPCHCFSDISV